MSASNSANSVAFMGNPAHFGEGQGPIHLNDVKCTGTEKSLLDCPIRPTTSCEHKEDVGVRCQ